MSDRPETVWIAGYEFRALYLEDYSLSAGGFVGSTDGQAQTIAVATVGGPQSPRETLLHEIVHQADRSGAAGDERMTESQVSRISRQLFAVLTDERNQGAIGWVLGGKVGSGPKTHGAALDALEAAFVKAHPDKPE